MFHRKSLGCLVVVCCALVAQRATNAGVVVTTSSSPPTDNLLTSYSVGYDNFAWSVGWTADTTAGHIDCAQSFLVSGPSDWSVDKITVKVRESGNSGATQGYTLQLWTVTDQTACSGNEVVTSQSDLFPSSGLAAGYWTFDLVDTTLSKGQYYAFALGFNSGPDAGRYFNLVHAYSAYDLFTDGRMFFRVGTPPTWSSPPHISDRDFEFYVQGNPVPEPATLSLVGAGAASLLLMAWRRRRPTR